MSYKTIRRNSSKTIRSYLEQCAVITVYKYDDHCGAERNEITADDVMKAGEKYDFDRVYLSVEGEEWTQIHCGIHGNYFFTGYRSKEVAKRLMTAAAFAEHFPEDAAAEREQQEEEARAAYAARVAEDAQLLASMTTTEPQPVFYVGQRIVATFASLNKNNHIADYIRECQKEEFGEKYWYHGAWNQSPNWRKVECRVDMVYNMTAAEYDELATNLMEDRADLFAEFTGGTHSDFDCGREVAEFWQLTPEEQEKWSAQSFNVVGIVQAPGRVPFVVDPQGYQYARYVALDPVALTSPLVCDEQGQYQLIFH